MERKTRRNIYILIGLTVLLLVGMVLGWFFVLVKPQRESLAAMQTQFNARQTIASTMIDELKKQKKAEDRKKYLDGQLVFFLNRYRNFEFPALTAAETETSKGPRLKLWRGLIQENYENYGTALVDVLVRARDASDDPSDGQKFDLTTSVKVDAPPKTPEDVTIPATAFVRPLSTTGSGVLSVSIKGSFAEIKDFLAHINLSPILFVVGNIKLDGVSPNITATFTLTPYLIAQGEGIKLAPAAAAATTTTATTPTEGAPPGPGGAGPAAPVTATPP